MSSPGGYFFARKICLRQEDMSSPGRYVFARRICLRQEDMSSPGGYVFARKICLRQEDMYLAVERVDAVVFHIYFDDILILQLRFACWAFVFS